MHSLMRRPFLRTFSLGWLVLFLIALAHSGGAAAVNVDSECAALYGSGFTPSTGYVTAGTSTKPARPLKGVVKRDSAFGTCVIRATDHAVEPPTNFARNDYARRQAFNADNTKFISYASGGGWHLYDANTLLWIKQLSGISGTAEPQWHPTDPNSLYYVGSGGGLRLNKLNIGTNTSTVAADFTGRLWSGTARVWTRGEGSPSADGRYWCFLAETSANGILGVFTYDLQMGTIVGRKSLTTRPNHVSMSPSGRWCVISGTTAWNRTFTTSRTLLSGSQHNDLAIGANGNDHYVFVDYAGNGYLTMVDIDTGTRTAIMPTYIDGTTTSAHISGKAFSRPGWILLGTFNHSGSEKYLHERVMAVEMKASPKIINLAHHYTYYNGYWTQPHASVSRNFTRLVFNSNWGSTSSMDVDEYMVRLPDNLFGGTTTTTADTTAPKVTAAVTGTSGTITLAATASDNIGVKSVDFMVDGVLKGSDASSPFSLPLASGTLVNGSHSLVAIAYDAAANAGKSAAVAFSVDNTSTVGTTDTTAPKVTASVSVASGSITMKAVASDNVGVARVEFYIDGVIKGYDTTKAYSLYWNTSTWWPGSTHSLVAKAYDNAGNVRASSPLSFTIP